MDLRKVCKVGNLNPIFYNYGSDLNYCHRIVHSGFTVGINLEAILIHKKEDRDYQKSFLKTCRLNNAYYMALAINPWSEDKFYTILLKIGRAIFSNLLRLNFRTVVVSTLTLFFIILKSRAIKNVKIQDA